MRLTLSVCSIVFLLFFSVKSNASILISEILADPAAGIAGDSNNDGVGSSYDDEMVELYNLGDFSADISGWYISDNVSIRHLFPVGSEIPSFGYLVVFGGGMPKLDDISWQVSSSGTLSLNNSGDIISLYDEQGLLVDQVPYGSEAGHDQSITREILNKNSSFILHSNISEAEGRLFSPGTAPDGSVNKATVPEASSILYLFAGLFPALRLRTFVRKIFKV